MIISELIDILQTYPPDTQVFGYDCEVGNYDVEEVVFSKEALTCMTKVRKVWVRSCIPGVILK